MHPSGLPNIYAGPGRPGACYSRATSPYNQHQQLGRSVSAPQSLDEQPAELNVQTCVHASVRLLGEAVAVLEGVRLLGSQLLQWGGELHQVLQSFLPAALLLQICRWLCSRTVGASRRRTLSRLKAAWQEASAASRPGTKLPLSGSSSSSILRLQGGGGGRLSSWLSILRDLSAFSALIVVAAELYIHFHLYR